MSNPRPNNCPFCLENELLRTGVIAETEGAYVTQALGTVGCHLIVPREHIETPLHLPNSWTQDVKELLPQIPDLTEKSYNLSFNIGPDAGQTVTHLHMWVIPRLAGKPSSGIGLARFVALADEAES